MKTRRKNPKNKEIKKRTRVEKVVKPMIEVIPKEKDRKVLFKKLHNSNVCIAISTFQSAVIIWIRDENIREIMLKKLAGLREVRSNKNKYIFVTSPRYNMEILEKIVRGIAKKIKQEREQDHARSFIFYIIFLIPHQNRHGHFAATFHILRNIYSNC